MVTQMKVRNIFYIYTTIKCTPNQLKAIQELTPYLGKSENAILVIQINPIRTSSSLKREITHVLTFIVSRPKREAIEIAFLIHYLLFYCSSLLFCHVVISITVIKAVHL